MCERRHGLWVALLVVVTIIGLSAVLDLALEAAVGVVMGAAITRRRGQRAHVPLIQRAMRRLTPKEREVIQRRWLTDDPKTIDEIATEEGITRQGVDMREKKAMKKLRAELRALGASRTHVDLWNGA